MVQPGSLQAYYGGEETRLLGKTARRYAVTKLRALAPVMAKCTLLKRDRPLHPQALPQSNEDSLGAARRHASMHAI